MNRMMRAILKLMKSAVAALLVLLPGVAFAQSFGSSEALTFSLSPTSPRPGATVVITPQSSLFDTINSTMSATVNGKSFYSGPTKSISVTLGSIGQTTSVKISVTSLGRSYSKSVSFNPQDVSLIAEPDGTAPALYGGKPLVAEGGRIRLVAIVDFRTSPSAKLDPNTLSYTWSRGGATLVSSSGIGRTSVVVPSPLLYRSEVITVAVTSPGGSLSGGDSVTISPATPLLRLYVSDPLQGILFDHALSDSKTITSSETTLIAVPYSLSNLTVPVITWFLNGSVVQDGPLITLRPQGGGQGAASLTTSAKGSGPGAPVTASLSLTFGSSGTNLFGL
jgi:hypothetical protein